MRANTLLSQTLKRGLAADPGESGSFEQDPRSVIGLSDYLCPHQAEIGSVSGEANKDRLQNMLRALTCFFRDNIDLPFPRGDIHVRISVVFALMLGLATTLPVMGSAKGLTVDDLENTPFVVEHHLVKLDQYGQMPGASKMKTVEADEDDINRWSMSMDTDQVLLADLNGDGLKDAAAIVRYGCVGIPHERSNHLVIFINNNSKPKQISDFRLGKEQEMYSAQLTVASGLLNLKWQDGDRRPHWHKAIFKSTNGKFQVQDPPPGIKIEDLPLAVNPADIDHPAKVTGGPSMNETVSFPTGIKAGKMTEALIKQGLAKTKDKLQLVDEYNGYGHIKSISYGDLNGDKIADAAVLFEIERADNTQVLLIPAVLDHGQLCFVGKADLGAKGFDIMDSKSQISGGIIIVSLQRFDRESRSVPPGPWVPVRLKLYEGNKLIKLK